MSWGDPTKMSESARESGKQGLKLGMSRATRHITEASGSVSDHRRLVSFVYLLLRSNMPFGKMASVMQALRSIDERKREALLGGLALVTVEAYVDRLVGDDYDRAKMVDWLALVFRWSDQPDQIPMLFDILPAHDDTTTVFSNGWAANYAKYIVELLHGGEETKQGEAVGPT